MSVIIVDKKRSFRNLPVAGRAINLAEWVSEWVVLRPARYIDLIGLSETSLSRQSLAMVLSTQKKRKTQKKQTQNKQTDPKVRKTQNTKKT